MKLIKKYFLHVFPAFILLIGCSESPTNSSGEQSGTLIFEKLGLVDSLVGTCSAYLIRTTILDSIDTRNYSNLKVEFKAYTDGDLSNVSFYFSNADTNYNLIDLNGSNRINSSSSFSFSSPKIKDNFYLRLRLFSSVCTGQYYHLKIRDLKIYGTN